MEKKLIYMDNAATTPVKPEVLDAMLPYFTEKFGNPSSIYSISSENKKAITDAREVIAKTINTTPENIYFTAGGSESDNWALKATADAYASKGKHIITTKIEHHAILHTCEYLETKGFEITYLDVDENGLVKLDELTAAIRPDTILISVMFANNEIGTIEPIAEIGKIAHEHGVLFHTDAVQAYTQVPIDVEAMNIDMMSTSGHKINGPKGIGFLYIRKGVKIKSFIKVRDHLIERIEKEIPYAKLNGDRVKRLPNNVNFSFQFVEGESMLILLDSKGICASSGSACTSGSLDPSHVLLAIGLPHEIAHGSLRLTISDQITMEDADYVVDNLKEIVNHLREMSPLYEDFIKKNK